MYTLEIEGQPVAIINSSEEEAREIFSSKYFKDDLLCLDKDDGSPLWNGASQLFVRRAFDEEVAKFEVAFVKAIKDGSADRDDEDGYLTFLTPVRDATDED